MAMLLKKRVLVLLILLSFISCAKKIYQVAYPTLYDGKYDSEFPYKNCSQQLHDISTSICMITLSLITAAIYSYRIVW